MHAVAVADEAIRAGLGLQHVREVFCAHGGLLGYHVVGAYDVGHHRACKVGLRHMVDGGWVVAHKLKGAGGPKGGAGVRGHVAHALLDQVEHLNAKGAHGAL